MIAVLQHQALPSFFAFCSEDLIHQTKAMKRFLRQRESTLDKFCAAMECCPVSAAVRTAARRHAEDLLRQHRAAEEQALAAEGERLGRMLMEQLEQEEAARTEAERARQERQERRLRKREEAAVAAARAEAEARAKVEAKLAEELAAGEAARAAAEKEAADKAAAARTSAIAHGLISAAEYAGAEVQLLAASTALIVHQPAGTGAAAPAEPRRGGQKKRGSRSRKAEAKVRMTAPAVEGDGVGAEAAAQQASPEAQPPAPAAEPVGSTVLLVVPPAVLAAEVVVAAAPQTPPECGQVELELRTASAAWRASPDRQQLLDAAARLERALEARAESPGDDGCGGVAGMMQAARWLSLMLECAAAEEAGETGTWPPAPGLGEGRICDRFGLFVAEAGAAERELSFVRQLTSTELRGGAASLADLLLRTRSGARAAAVHCPEVVLVSLGWSCEEPALGELQGALGAVSTSLRLGSAEYELEAIGCAASDSQHLALRRCRSDPVVEWESTPQLAGLSSVRGLHPLFGGLANRGYIPTLLAYARAAE